MLLKITKKGTSPGIFVQYLCKFIEPSMEQQATQLKGGTQI